jgi:two-component system sensor histidine kinase KdpD
MRELRARLGPSDGAPGPLELLRRGEKRGRVVAGHVVAVAGTALAFVIFLVFRDQISPLSKGFGFLAVVVAAAAVGGLGPGVSAAVAGFVLFNFFFIPPYGTFRIDRGEDVVVLFVFLGLSVIISVLLARATERAEAAEARRNELEAIQWLSTELVAMRPGPDAYRTVLERVVSLFDMSSVTLSLQRVADFRGLQETATVRSDPIRPLGTFEERVPLSMGGRNLGLLLLQGNRGTLIAPEQRVLMAFAAQLSMMLERDRILAAAVRAQTDPAR